MRNKNKWRGAAELKQYEMGHVKIAAGLDTKTSDWFRKYVVSLSGFNPSSKVY